MPGYYPGSIDYDAVHNNKSFCNTIRWQVSLIVRFLEKNSGYQRKWWRIDSKIAGELLYHAKEEHKTRLQSNRILAILCYKVDMGNIYLSDLTCSDKPLNIRDGTKALFLKIILLSDEKFIFS